MQIYISFVEPQFTGNIGFLARTMANFDFEKLILVNPPNLDDDAYRFSKHARYIIENATVLRDFSELRDFLDVAIGTSGVSTLSSKKFNRIAISPESFGEKVWNFNGKVGIIFGRENHGLYNIELEKCDMLVRVPTSEKYPIMNITHAAAIVLYEIFKHRYVAPVRPVAESNELSLLAERFSDILKSIEFPPHKIKNTETMFRRIMGRAVLTKWEFHSMMGIMKRILYHLDEKT